jgi:hypothetical protein
MKRTILILFAICLFAESQAQIGRYPFARAGGKAKYTDTFNTYSAGNLAGQGNWVAALNNVLVVDLGSGDKAVMAPAIANDGAVRYNAIFSNNHYSKIVIKTVTGNSPCIGIVVRCSGSGATSKYYVYYTDAGTWRGLYVIVDGTDYLIAQTTSATIDDDDVMELRVSGTTVTALFNGVTDTALGSASSPATGSSGVYTDSRVSTGTPGIGEWGTTTANGTVADNWEGGDL